MLARANSFCALAGIRRSAAETSEFAAVSTDEPGLLGLTITGNCSVQGELATTLSVSEKFWPEAFNSYFPGETRAKTTSQCSSGVPSATEPFALTSSTCAKGSQNPLQNASAPARLRLRLRRKQRIAG